MLKNKETVAKEFGEKIGYIQTEDTKLYLPSDHSERDRTIFDAGYSQACFKFLSFLHSQRVADLEAVMGMVEGIIQTERFAGAPYALNQVLAKLDEVKGKIR